MAGIYTLTVTTTPKAWPRNYDLTRTTKHARAGLGLHPQLVAERSGEIKLWEEYLPQARYIGEVGLDAGPQYFRSLAQQQLVFTHILKKCGEANGKILSVHSVRAAKPVLGLIESHLPRERGKVVLHWFTGSNSEAPSRRWRHRVRAARFQCQHKDELALRVRERISGLILNIKRFPAVHVSWKRSAVLGRRAFCAALLPAHRL